jgi:hypothetical protein
MFTLRSDTSSTGSGMNTSAKSAVAPRAVFAGGVAVVGPEPAAAEDLLNNLTHKFCCNAVVTGAALDSRAKLGSICERRSVSKTSFTQAPQTALITQ